jgi:hypothetical protein
VLPAVVNQPPEISLTQAPATSGRPYFYAYEIFWTGYDPDGRVDHYLYAVDPPTAAHADTPWVYSTENRHTFLFRSDDADSLGTRTNPGGFHVFVITAVDDKGARSPVLSQAFFSYTVAPRVVFLQPKPNHIFPPILPPTTTISWTGDDPDGQTTRKPVKYRFKLFKDDGTEFDFLTLLVFPDSLRHYYAEHNWAGWDSVSGDTIRFTFTHLIPDSKYVLAVIAIDEAGAYSPVFSLDTNLLFFFCQFAAIDGPRFKLWNEYFSYTYPDGCYCTEPTRYVHIEVPWNQPVSFHWLASAHLGNFVRQYRWSMDIDRLDNEDPRTSQSDWSHWSFWGRSTTTATVGPFPAGQHLFYVEAEDDNGLRSLAIVQFRVVALPPESQRKDVLFVDDTRFAVDGLPRNGYIAPGTSVWPGAAELDTFLYARGGMPWRYVLPATAISTPGIFRGYRYDTLGTRGLPGGVPLATLANYRAVVWYGNTAFDYTKAPDDPVSPMPAMAWMSDTSRSNTLAVYARMGGNVWLFGGGIVFNTMREYNVTANDQGQYPVYSSFTGELGPGRFMYSIAGWRSQITLGSRYRAVRNDRLHAVWPGAPDYGSLPPALEEREGGDTPDPLPPMRNVSNFQAFYEAEVLTDPNHVLNADSTSALDTLYWAGELPGEPVMTLLHSSDQGRVVFSGFPVWFFHRDQAIQLSDFVLQRVFGLVRDTSTVRLPAVRLSRAPGSRVARR